MEMIPLDGKMIQSQSSPIPARKKRPLDSLETAPAP
jgi:hypothetical protein